MEKLQDVNEFLNTDEVITKINREIDELENKIDKGFTDNRKLLILKNLKISLLTSRRILPYIVTGGLTFGMFAFFNHTPFYLDEVKSTEQILNSLPPFKIEETEEYEAVPTIESNETNIEDTALWVTATIIAESIPLWYRSNYSSFDYYDRVRYAKKQFKPIDLSIEEEKLEKLKEEKQRIRG